jgi:tetraacyldisaccharide 4'-kinase
LYGLVVFFRNLLFDLSISKSISPGLPVITVGNITVGGTGKTPHVEYLIRKLYRNYRLAVISRGYKRKSKGFILASSDSDVETIGDEPLQIKQKFSVIPVAVDAQRLRGIQMLKSFYQDLQLIIMDDGYQHRKVKAGVSILLVSYVQPVFDDLLLPAGNLREPVRNMNRADIIIISKCPEDLSPSLAHDFEKQLKIHPHQKVFFTTLMYGAPQFLQQKEDQFIDLSSYTSALTVTGIANPGPFLKYLSGKINVEKQLEYPDHYSFTQKDLDHVLQTFNSITDENKIIITTEKDAVRLREIVGNNHTILRNIIYIPVEVTFLLNGDLLFMETLHKKLRLE